MSEHTMSKSQAKRQARREEIKRDKREAKRVQFITVTAAVLLVAIFVAVIGTFIYNSITQTTASSDYGAMLNEDGTVRDVNPLDYVEALEYKNMPIAQADITYTDEAINSEIDSLLSQNKALKTDSTLVAQDGDTLYIDYVGTIDGTAFEGGDTEGNGTDLTLGSGTYIDTFEDQLVGSHPGDKITVNVTFPEDYTNADLQGKPAVFEVTVNGIYVTPEFTDEFVAENLSEHASTVEEYKTWLKETRERENLETAVETKLRESVVATAYNDNHVKYLKSIGKYEQETYYESYNQMYYSFTGSYPYSSFQDYTGMSIKDFEAYLTEESQTRSAFDLTCQYIFTDAGLSISDADYEAKVSEIGQTSADSYGKAYVMQMIIKDKVIEYLADNAIVE